MLLPGLGSIALGAAMPLAATQFAGAGFFAGGLGAMATSILVAKDLRKASLPLKLAAFVGLPFGASLVALFVERSGAYPFPCTLVSLSVPVGAILGVTLMILLLTGFLSHAFSGSRSRVGGLMAKIPKMTLQPTDTAAAFSPERGERSFRPERALQLGFVDLGEDHPEARSRDRLRGRERIEPEGRSRSRSP